MYEAPIPEPSHFWFVVSVFAWIVGGLMAYIGCACVSYGYWSTQSYKWKGDPAPAVLWPFFTLFGIVLLPFFNHLVKLGEWLGTPRKTE